MPARFTMRPCGASIGVSRVEGEGPVSIDIGSAAELVAAGLGVLTSWLGLRSQVRQGQRHARAVEDLVEAMHVGGDEDRQRLVGRSG
jgi:hypothetical protein